jgi:endonuclease YncB( thermonuclease family)
MKYVSAYMTMRAYLATRFGAALIATLGTLLGTMGLCALPALAEDTLRGKANIVDGDTIDIAGIPIRLQGIDAPEQLQKCTADGGQVTCGKLATKALVRMIGSEPVTCILLGKDNYNRLLGECSAEGQSLNARMVRDGWALAFVKYSQRYVPEEEEARAARSGIWQWQFTKPWEWRAGILEEAAGTRKGPDGCVIKGNINRRGDRIYHMPFHQHYGRTQVDENKGERWFCSEEEAQVAGWRRALR